MLLSQFLLTLNQIEDFRFQTPKGEFVPPHFHITEVGMSHKHFIDCGGTERKETKVNFQLWSSDDIQHRLNPQKVFPGLLSVLLVLIWPSPRVRTT